MPWRKWLVRGLVFSIAAGLAVAALLYQRWTNPTAVRLQVLKQLSEQFTGATVSLDSARMRLLGGIALSDLRMVRRDDQDRTDFLMIPSGVIYLDKEQLLDGTLAILKLELQRPRLHIIRQANGDWNLASVLGPVDLNQRLPTIVIQHGTVLLEDRQAAPGTLPLEIKDVNLTLVNDPIATLIIEGTGVCEVAGTIQIAGRWQRATNVVALSLEAPRIPVGPPLVQRLASYSDELAAHARQLEGVGKVHAELSHDPAAGPSWNHDARLELSQGRLSHALLPLPLENLNASFRITNGLVALGRITAQSGPATVDATVKDLIPSACPNFESLLRELDVTVKHLTLTPELFARLPDTVRDCQKDFDPQGPLSLTYEFRRETRDSWKKHCRLQPEDMSGMFKEFPYRIEHITGTIDHFSTPAQSRLVKVDLVGYAGTRPVYIKGEVEGESPGHRVAFDIWGDDLTLDKKLEAALPLRPHNYQTLAHSFHPTGLGNFKAYVRRDPQTQKFSNRFIIHFHHAAVRYDVFPYPLEEVTGDLEILPGYWEFRDFRGMHKGGEFRTKGRSIPEPKGDHVIIDIQGNNILLDEEMEAALKPEMRQTWKVFAPSGRIDFNGTVDSPAGSPADDDPNIELTVNPRGCSIKPAFFSYAMDDLHGQVRYARPWIYLDKLQARHGKTNLGLEHGDVYVKPGGGIWAKLVDLWGNPILPEADFVNAMPSGLQKACQGLAVKDPVYLKTLLTLDCPAQAGSSPSIYWDGWVHLRDATLQAGVRMDHVSGQIACRGAHNGKELEGVVGNVLLDQAMLLNQPFRDIQSQFEVPRDAPDVLRLPGLHAQLFGGEVYGPLRVELGSTVRYELKLTASQIQLEEFGRHNLGSNSKIKGLATAQLYLSGQGSELSGLQGSGNVDVPSGQMYNLPLLLDLLKVLGLRPPDRTAFEEAHASFKLNGARVTVNRLDLFGNAISLRGQGELNLDGSDLNLDFNADWGRITQMLPPGIKKIPPAISNGLFKIKMRGKIGDVQCTKEPVPVLVDPFMKVWNGMREPLQRPRE